MQWSLLVLGKLLESEFLKLVLVKLVLSDLNWVLKA
jgi:hypothetical protein